MFILVLKQDGLLPVVKQTGETVDVGLLGAIPCRAPTYEELSENLTIPQVKNMLKAVGIKNVGKTKEMVMRSIVRGWEMIEQRALSLQDTIDMRGRGSTGNLIFMNHNCYSAQKLHSGDVFKIETLRCLSRSSLDVQEITETMKLSQIKTFIEHHGFTPQPRTTKQEMAHIVFDAMQDLVNGFENSLVRDDFEASTDEGTGQSSEDEGLDDGDAVSLSSPISCATSPSELLGFKTEPVPELEGLMTLKAPRENGKTLLVVFWDFTMT